MIKTGIDKLDYYTEGVHSGEINACKWVKLAVERHYRDLEKDWEYYFEPKAATHFIEYCSENLTHYEGAIRGEPLLFEPWQYFIYGSIFGWLKKERYKNIPIRRFRDGIIIVPKKNGKSIMSGSVALYMIEYDGWAGAQCYILAKNQTHAKDLGYRAATIMVKSSKELSSKYRVNRSAADAGIYFDGNNSFYKPITSKPESEDGRNVHFCGPDETKDWTDFEIYDVMKNGTVNAPNSLFMSTTTAGNNRESLGFQQQVYVEKMLNGIIEDDATFGIIYGVDEEDKEGDEWWTNPKVWQKANPNYGVSVFEDALKSMIPTAKESLNKRIAFETKHLNIWHSSSEAYIPHERWKKCGTKKFKSIHDFKGRKAWGGVDLGSVSDFTAFVLVFEPVDNVWDVLCFFWIPKDTINERKNMGIIREFVEGGWIETTDGDVTDHDFIEAKIKEIASIVDLQEIAYDRYKMDMMINHLQDEGIEMTPFGQGYVSMNPAVDGLETFVLQNKIEHFGNPVLAWMNSNVTIKKDPAGNRKFDKDKSQDKIDGMVALGMALNRATFQETEGSMDWEPKWI